MTGWDSGKTRDMIMLHWQKKSFPSCPYLPMQTSILRISMTDRKLGTPMTDLDLGYIFLIWKPTFWIWFPQNNIIHHTKKNVVNLNVIDFESFVFNVKMCLVTRPWKSREALSVDAGFYFCAQLSSIVIKMLASLLCGEGPQDFSFKRRAVYIFLKFEKHGHGLWFYKMLL